MIRTSRERFEQWIENSGMHANALQKIGEIYASDSVQEKWEGWCASESSFRESLPVEPLKDLRWRIIDTRITLLARSHSDEAIYGCDEWSAPIVNLDLALSLIESLLLIGESA